MQTQQAALAQIIRAIGEPDFVAVAAQSLREHIAFDLVAVVAHRRDSRPTLMFDNFEAAGGRDGIENYIRFTHVVNPLLDHAKRCRGAFRASDFGLRGSEVAGSLRPYLKRTTDEELGFRTVGWPQRMEEIGLYFDACGGMVELGLYRERGRRHVERDKLECLAAMRAPLGAAFERHAALQAKAGLGRPALEPRATDGPRAAREPSLASVAASHFGAAPAVSALSPRETEVTALLLQGYDSRAIALQLGISCYTVKDHRKRIFRKLRVSSLAQLFANHRQLIS